MLRLICSRETLLAIAAVWTLAPASAAFAGEEMKITGDLRVEPASMTLIHRRRPHSMRG